MTLSLTKSQMEPGLNLRPDPSRSLLTRWPVPVTECLCFELRDYFDDGVCYWWMLSAKSLVHAAHNDVKTQSTQNPTDSTVSYFSQKSDNNARAKATKSWSDNVSITRPDPTWPCQNPVMLTRTGHARTRTRTKSTRTQWWALVAKKVVKLNYFFQLKFFS